MFRRSAHVAIACCLAPLSVWSADEQPAAPPLPNLLRNASFEEPAITKRTPMQEGGSPAKTTEDKTLWTHFQVLGKEKEGEGKLSVGMTNEYARTGSQSVYVDLQKVTAVNRRAQLMTDLFPIKPGNTYRIGIWGRTDKSRPLTLDQRRIYLQVEAAFFSANMEEQVGDEEIRTQVIPGSPKRLRFISTEWNEFFAEVKTPRDAGTMKVTFIWNTGREAGETDGTIYFDDASVALVPGGESLVPVTEEEAAANAAAAEAREKEDADEQDPEMKKEPAEASEKAPEAKPEAAPSPAPAPAPAATPEPKPPVKAKKPAAKK